MPAASAQRRAPAPRGSGGRTHLGSTGGACPLGVAGVRCPRVVPTAGGSPSPAGARLPLTATASARPLTDGRCSRPSPTVGAPAPRRNGSGARPDEAAPGLAAPPARLAPPAAPYQAAERRRAERTTPGPRIQWIRGPGRLLMTAETAPHRDGGRPRRGRARPSAAEEASPQPYQPPSSCLRASNSPSPVRQGAEEAEAGDAAVGVDVHAGVGAHRRGREDEAVVGVGLEAGAGRISRQAPSPPSRTDTDAQPAALPFR